MFVCEVLVTIKRVREMAVYVAMEVTLYRNGPNSDGVDDTFSDKRVAHPETCSSFWQLLSPHTVTCAW